jgi:hypothetical protein
VSLRIVPVTYETAAGFNRMWHRTHERPPPSHKFSIGVADDMDILRGVAIVGRPVSRFYDNGLTLEVNRTATDGTRNANSMLYGSCWNAAKALGFRRLITYNVTPTEGPACEGTCPHESCFIIRASESGASLKGAGWVIIAQRPPRPGWDTPSRPRESRGADCLPRTLWEAS